MKGNHKHGHGAKGRETPTYRSWMALRLDRPRFVLALLREVLHGLMETGALRLAQNPNYVIDFELLWSRWIKRVAQPTARTLRFPRRPELTRDFLRPSEDGNRALERVFRGLVD